MALTDPLGPVRQYIDDFYRGVTFKVHNQQVVQNGAVFTVALRKLDDGWHIAAWAWAKGTRG